MKKLFVIIALCLLTGCLHDKVKYVDVNEQCKYIEIDGEPFSCEEMKNPGEFYKVYVDTCLGVVENNGEYPSTYRCFSNRDHDEF
jgi:hypothetical protein